MAGLRLVAVAAHFGRDLGLCLDRIAAILARARSQGADLVVLPDATLGGYLSEFDNPGPDALPPALHADDPIFAELCRLAGEMVVCVGYCERDDAGRIYNAAVALSGDGVLGRHRKVHQPYATARVFSAGTSFAAFDTPVGRVGLMIDYDKTFPESARTLALDGATMLACLSAWPASITRRTAELVSDRQMRLFDLYDAARAAENQVLLLSANQSGTMGQLRFLGSAKVVGPGGAVLARTGAKGGLAVASVDVEAEVGRARRVLHHLQERQLGAYEPSMSGLGAPT